MSDSSIGNADRKWLFQGLGLTVVVVVLAILFSLINPKFATITNFLNVLTQASYYIILAVGMTFVIAAAGIDLSVGSLLALITVVNFELIKNGLHPLLGVLLMFIMGGTLGAFTGYLISYINIPPFIATLGIMVSLRGLALVHSAGKMHYGLPESLTWIGQGDIYGIPVPVLISLVFALFGGKGTVYGTLMGAILLSMMTNALVIAGVDYFWQLFIMGIIVLIAVTINNIRDKRFLFNSKL